MTRLAGRLTSALAVTLVAAGGALAADIAASTGGDLCGPSQIVTAPYKEQICYGGAHGYAACRWVRREYAVRIPAECPRDDLIEDAFRLRAHPAPHRGGVVAKG